MATIVTTKQRTRERLIQALYRWQIGQETAQEIEQDYLNKSKKEDNISKQYFRSIFPNIVENHQALDEQINVFLDREMIHIGAVEHAILWLALYELLHLETPTDVVLNEAVELAKRYGGDGSYKHINAVLDRLAKNIKHGGK